jgi:hypothetical protein
MCKKTTGCNNFEFRATEDDDASIEEAQHRPQDKATSQGNLKTRLVDGQIAIVVPLRWLRAMEFAKVTITIDCRGESIAKWLRSARRARRLPGSKPGFPGAVAQLDRVRRTFHQSLSSCWVPFFYAFYSSSSLVQDGVMSSNFTFGHVTVVWTCSHGPMAIETASAL